MSASKQATLSRHILQIISDNLTYLFSQQSTFSLRHRLGLMS